MAAYSNTAIVFGDVKQSLLYYDRIIPLTHYFDWIIRKKTGRSFIEGADGLDSFKLNELLPASLLARPNFLGQYVKTTIGVGLIMARILAGKLEEIPAGVADDNLPEEVRNSKVFQAYTQFCKFIDDFNLGEIPIDTENYGPPATTDPNWDPVVVLASLKLVDAKRIPWEQLIEFRRDRDAQDKLRRLRLFAYANYQGKSRSYIEDDVHKRIEDYEAAVSKWHFETAEGAINTVLSSKVMGGAVAGSILTSLAGAPTVAVALAAGGTVLELGRVTLQVAKQRVALRSLHQDHPVSFISRARQLQAQ